MIFWPFARLRFHADAAAAATLPPLSLFSSILLARSYAAFLRQWLYNFSASAEMPFFLVCHEDAFALIAFHACFITDVFDAVYFRRHDARLFRASLFRRCCRLSPC